MTGNITKRLKDIRVKGSNRARSVTKKIKSRPMRSFFGALVVLILILLAIKFLGQPEPQEEVVENEVREVKAYQIGAVPTLTVQAKIEKTGVVTIMAQTGGVVNRINFDEGQSVSPGQTLVNLAATYTGANGASVQRQIAQKNFESAQENLPIQLDLIAKRRELAQKSDENTNELRELSENSLNRTRGVLDVNQQILETLTDNLEILEEASPQDEAAILSARQLRAQSLSAVNGLRDAVENLEYTSDEDNPPRRLGELNREIALKGLDLEERGYKMGVDIAQLNLRLARIGEAIYYPQAPFGGVVERVYVKPGQMVSPGMPLMAIAGNSQSVKAVALVSREVATKVSRWETSTLNLPLGRIEQVPQYVATEPTDGNLYAITWCQLDTFVDQLNSQSYISVEIPVGYPDSLGTSPFIPIDSVYQTQDEAFVFVATPGQENQEVQTATVESRQIELGSVYGNYVLVNEGIGAGDVVVLDRSVVSGDQVVISL